MVRVAAAGPRRFHARGEGQLLHLGAKPNVLVLVSDVTSPGGAERLARRLAAGLASSGLAAPYLASVYAPRGDLTAALPSGTEYLGDLGLEGPPLELRHAARRLRELVRSAAIEVVEASLMGPSSTAALGCRGTRALLIVGVHAVYGSGVYPIPLIKRLVWRRLLKRANGIYAVSAHALEDWRQLMRLDAGGRIPHTVIHNSVEPHFSGQDVSARRMIREELAVGPDTPLLLYVGRVVRGKGIETVLEVGESLAESVGARTVIAGSLHDADPGLTRLFLERCESPNFHYLGHREDVPALMRAADLLVFPTRSEAFGLVVAEALSIGLPVVSARSPGVAEAALGAPVTYVDGFRTEEWIAVVRDRLRRGDRERIGAGRVRTETQRARQFMEFARSLDGRARAV